MLTKTHNYERIIKKMIAEGKIPASVGVSHIYVMHDDWCEIYNGGYCNCNPEVTFNPPKTPLQAVARGLV